MAEIWMVFGAEEYKYGTYVTPGELEKRLLWRGSN